MGGEKKDNFWSGRKFYSHWFPLYVRNAVVLISSKYTLRVILFYTLSCTCSKMYTSVLKWWWLWSGANFQCVRARIVFMGEGVVACSNQSPLPTIAWHGVKKILLWQDLIKKERLKWWRDEHLLIPCPHWNSCFVSFKWNYILEGFKENEY